MGSTQQHRRTLGVDNGAAVAVSLDQVGGGIEERLVATRLVGGAEEGNHLNRVDATVGPLRFLDQHRRPPLAPRRWLA